MVPLLFVVGVPALAMATQTNVGDTGTTNQLTQVYESYQPGILGETVCMLAEGQDVIIRTILTANDLPGHEQTMFSEVKAYLVETSSCKSWILPEYLK
ncbi:hypothetical protein A2V80_02725 [Candidatus Woesebacteria bacterium RBG_16_39_8b]|uniref:Uncharacterized protein n=1 Tax=Candidatus Woesebacteria bacterium RBG_16_39_8b TaxID=1802482 RepID=A0A1F7X9Q9_9BACT|nr:MAG: hypothetical protein A2V80_02725 [Candidatus Woesebacteria bacterium RBG_16_39_8b]